MKRTPVSLLAVLAGGTVALGCSGGSSAGPSTTTNPATEKFAGTSLQWMTTEARPWNARLNADQNAIDQASSAKGASAHAYFSGLRTACTRMLEDAGKAQQLPTAPLATLDQAWKAMTADTIGYASSCLDLARTHSSADLTDWQASLSAMNAANASLNTVVDGVRGVPAG